MKKAATKRAQESQTPVFPKTLHQPRAQSPSAVLEAKPAKRDNVFSKSRDTREDRGARQMKTSHSAQTFSHR
jgi:hypothetical protein